MMTSKIFFPHLDGMRFFAFLYVFLFHCYYGLPAQVADNPLYQALHFLWGNGDLGVNFFFTLSGFLITYLLLAEEQHAGKINLASFYFRRVIRIWPLYYLTFIFGYFIFHYLVQAAGADVVETADPLYYLFFLGNFNSIANGAPVSSSLSVLWSIAIEEQFYLCWPLLLIAFKQNRILLFLAVIITSLLFRSWHLDDPDMLFYHTFSVMSDLAIGGLLAWWCMQRRLEQSSLSLLPKSITLLIYLSGFLLMLFRKDVFVSPVLLVSERLIFSLFFAFIIFEQSYFSNSFYKMARFTRISHWGRYTYGLYCLHIPAMVFTVGFAMALGWEQLVWWELGIKTLLTLLLSFAFSWLSFHYLEQPFLRLKNTYSFNFR
jgi:peptidoglycan/LPS O-acetylase OafA/YrhL